MNLRLAAPKSGIRIVRFLVTLLAVTLMAVTALSIIGAGVFYSLYSWLLARILEHTGLDIWASRAIAVALMAFVWSLPWQVFILPWMGSAKRQATSLLIVIAFALVAMEFMTRDVYFSRANGRPLKYYIQTLDGYKFSSSPGTDPVYGIPYRPVTQDLARAYIVWKARGGQMQDPSVPEGLNFNPSTGEPLRWYAKLPDGRIDLFTLPGFHPRYGIKLAPATADILAECERQKRAAERQRQEEKNAGQRREAMEAERKAEEARSMARAEATRQAREARKRKIIEEVLAKRPLRPGRYLLSDPYPRGTVNGFRFTLTEIDIRQDKALVHLDVDNVGPVSPGNGIRLDVLSKDGTIVGYTAVRPKEGDVADRSGFLVFPGQSKHGAFVMEFEGEEKLLPTFSRVANDQPLFSGVNLRKATYMTF